MSKSYENKRYFGMALDPIHIGTGGYRLGRVDNTIARDPATNLPIIFGSSIEGTARTYSAYKLVEETGDKKYLNCASKTTDKKKQCGKCEICITYGYTNDELTDIPKSLHGMAQFSDARILFFPVHTMIGPVWVTSPQILKDIDLGEFSIEDKDKIKTNWIEKGKKLNLGWLYLENEDGFSIPNGELDKIPKEIKERVVLVSDKLFSQIVNSSLEVRTSVSINPETGAAEEGALFTYEAIPRSTIMYFNVVYNNPEYFKGIPMYDIKQIVEKGLCLFEHLGLGGMQTRGFGRFKVLNLEEDCNAKST